MSVYSCIPAYSPGSALANPPVVGIPVPGLPPTGLTGDVFTGQPVVSSCEWAAPAFGQSGPMPSWLSRLTSAFAGTPLMVGGRMFLKYLANRCSGPLWWDAVRNRMSVGWPDKAQHLAATGYATRGYLPIVEYVEKSVDVEGQTEPQTIGLFQHGVQQVQDAAVGKLMVLDIDPVTATVRRDVLIPTVTANASVPAGSKVLGYYLTTQTDAAGVQKEVVNWMAVDLSSILARLTALEAR